MITIFIETRKPTTSEYHFIDDYVGKHLGIAPSQYKIECVNGKDNLKNAANTFKLNPDPTNKNLIIFDADFQKTGGGYEKRYQELRNTIATLGIDAELFLFPNNHDDGTFETLLENIMQKETHQSFFDCFNDYDNCLGNEYEHPNLKGKVFTYISSMKSLSNKARKNLGAGDWQFTNKEYWNLDAEYLKPLKEFIETAGK